MPADSAELRGKTHKLDFFQTITDFLSEVTDILQAETLKQNLKPLTAW